MTTGRLRPHASAFASRFTVMMQYRSAALAGFFTQCWWGGIKVMVLAAFYASPAGEHAPMSFAQAVTYTWLAQGLLALLPWSCDPDLAASIRSGNVAFDRLRPADSQALWTSRCAGWIAARALPRVALMFAFAAVALPVLGLARWSWRPPSGAVAGLLFAASLALALALSAAIVLLMSTVALATLSDRGVTALAAPLVTVFSGNVLPLALLPDALQPLLLAQPFAGLADIPLRLYVGELAGPAALGALSLQAAWVLVVLGFTRAGLTRVLRRLEIQGG